MSFDLPPPLRLAADRLMVGVSRKDMAQRAGAICGQVSSAAQPPPPGPAPASSRLMGEKSGARSAASARARAQAA